MGMVNDVIANAAEEGAPDFTHASGTRHDQLAIFFICNFAYHLSWVTTNRFDFPADLRKQRNHDKEGESRV